MAAPAAVLGRGASAETPAVASATAEADVPSRNVGARGAKSTRPARATTASASSSRARSISRSRSRSRSRLSARFERMSRSLAAEICSLPRRSSLLVGWLSPPAEGSVDEFVSVEATLSTEGVLVIRSGALALAGPLDVLRLPEVDLVLLPNQVDLRAGRFALSPCPPPPVVEPPFASGEPFLACTRQCAKLAPSPARLDTLGVLLLRVDSVDFDAAPTDWG